MFTRKHKNNLKLKCLSPQTFLGFIKNHVNFTEEDVFNDILSIFIVVTYLNVLFFFSVKRTEELLLKNLEPSHMI